MLHNHHSSVAKSSLLFKSMPEEVVDTLLNESTVRSFSRNETVFHQGDEAHTIHLVLDGWVKIYRIAPNGNEAVVSVFARGDSFGEAVAFQNGLYPVSGEAVTDCTLAQIPARSFVTRMKEEPELCLAILASTFQHLHQLVEQLEQLKAQTGAQRLAEFLLDLCPAQTGSCTVTLPYDKVLIAGRLGMKPESLSRAIAKLQGSGVHIARNHAKIDSVETLRNYAEEDPPAAWNKTS